MMGDYTEYSFLGYVMPPVIAILGDKLWDGSERSHTEEYRAALSEFLFGTDALTCIFDCVGDLLPPRYNHIFVEPDAPMPTKETVASCLAVLSTIQNENYRFHVREYTRLLNNIMEQVTKV
jgi:hypothetical protein